MALLDRFRKPDLIVDYGDSLKLVPSRLARIGLLFLVFLYFWLPSYFPDFELSVLNQAGVFAIGAIGLNLLTGYTGQVSLGHAFFLAIGGYTWAHFGGEQHMAL